MKYRTLGRTGWKVSEISFGGWAIGGGWGDVLGTVLTGHGGRREGALESMAKSAARSVGSTMGRQLGNAVLRGVLGSMLKR